MELLAPAGSFEALVAAVQSGADAVYIGGSEFSARRSAANFTLEEIEKAALKELNETYYNDKENRRARYKQEHEEKVAKKNQNLVDSNKATYVKSLGNGKELWTLSGYVDDAAQFVFNYKESNAWDNNNGRNYTYSS